MLPEFESANALFSQYDLDVSHETYQKLEEYAAFLVAYNEKVNLTAITDGDAILKKHFIDSLLLHGKCRAFFPQGGQVLDIGSGAGRSAHHAARFAGQAHRVPTGTRHSAGDAVPCDSRQSGADGEGSRLPGAV